MHLGVTVCTHTFNTELGLRWLDYIYIYIVLYFPISVCLE